MAEPTPHRDPETGLTADELEQRQRADGTFEEPTTIDHDAASLSPDVIEQHQRLDGSFEGQVEDTSGEPLTPDMIEQRQVVEDDDADDHPPG